MIFLHSLQCDFVVVVGFNGNAVISTCRVFRGEVTSAARLIRWHHPHTRAGGPTAIPAPLQEDTNTVRVLGDQSQLLTVGVAKCDLEHEKK